MTDLLDHWQELIGAVIGGLMGFIGAWWVSSSAEARERRSAARLLVISLTLSENVYRRITESLRDKPADWAVGAWIAPQLMTYQNNLSEQFERQTSQVAHLRVEVGSYLVSFLVAFRRMSALAATITERMRSAEALPARHKYEENLLTQDLERVHYLAQRAVYFLLPECTSWWWPRWAMKRDRALFPTDEDIEMRTLKPETET